jgi:type III secretion system low calcium response chaperone LcrH/SycD
MLEQQLATLDPKDREAVETFISKAIEKMEKEKKSLQEVLGIKEETLDRLYLTAYTWYYQGHYAKAHHYFKILVTTCPKNASYLYGMASSLFQLEDYVSATSFFIATMYQDASYVEAAYFASECLIKREEIPAALEMLNLAIDMAEESEKYAPLKERCKLIKKTLILKK